MQRIVLVFLLVILVLPVFSQKQDTKAEKLYRKAVESYERRNYLSAMSHLDELLKEIPNHAEGWLLKADIYNDLQQFSDAVICYSKSVEIDSTLFPPALYIMGNLYFDLENYRLAKQYYLRYLNFNPKIQAELRRMNENIPLCIYRDSMMLHPVEYNPVNVGPNVNSDGYEYVNAVSLDEGQLYFTRKGSDARSDESFYRSVSARSSSGMLNWSPAIEIGSPINTPGNEGALCVSPDGMSIIITCCSRPDSYGSCDLYFSQKRGNTWTEPQNLGPFVNTQSWESQPGFAADGRTLYFVSTRRGGYGGSDIYKTILQADGTWSRPENLGDSINTSADEMAPFIHPDGKTLYFSSKGHKGMGGADLFVSRQGKSGRWMKPENLGYPLNTKKDEINLVINAHGTEAYISAEREKGFGKIDIFRFELPEASRPQFVTYVQGKVFDKNTEAPLAANFQLIDLKTDSVVVSSISDMLTGEFLLTLPVDKDYALNVSKSGYLFYSMNFSLNSNNDFANPQRLLIPLQPIAVGEKVVLRNIFFETDKFDLLPDSKVELGKLISFLLKNQAMSVEIGGHTDNEGSDAHNLVLSGNRAKAVYDYLIANGIDSKRLSYKGYGETIPVESNASPEGRAKNRRTEFKVIGK